MAEAVDRPQWDSSVQFILTCIGYAVGLGNIWRFPSLAYENGGGAFLIPYLTCSFLVGFPLLYLEMSLGQFARAGPAIVYGRIRPLFQGIGWCMAGLSLLVSVYYNVIVAWILIYLWMIVTGQSHKWSSYCESALENLRCVDDIGASNVTHWAFFFNGTCHYGVQEDVLHARDAFYNATLPAVSPAEEFFEYALAFESKSLRNYVLQKTATMDEFGGFNIKVVVALAVAWILTCLVLCKGVKVMGKLSLFTATIPYVIIVMLFIRGITLDGAEIGLKFYLLEPRMSAILEPKTWRSAATHVCYSLAIGFGGLLSLSSFNPHHHNCFRDAMIITVADGFMSVFGGTAVFSVLGFMSKQLGLSIDKVVQQGTGLAFIAYPEAMSRMPMPWLWSILFFLMLFILGISSQFGLAEVMITALADQWPAARRQKAWVSVCVCLSLFLCGLVMTTRAGIFYFTIFDDYSASFSLMLLIILEIVLVVYIYGIKEYLVDLRSMLGVPKSCLGKWLGPTGYYVQAIWRFVAPLEAVVIFVVVLIQQLEKVPEYGKGNRLYKYPGWALVVAWVLSLLPLTTMPALIIYNFIKFYRQGRSCAEFFKLQPKWPAYERITKKTEETQSSHRNGNSNNRVAPEDENSASRRRRSSAFPPPPEWTPSDGSHPDNGVNPSGNPFDGHMVETDRSRM